MANVRVKNGAGADVYLKATGAGSDGDPHIPEHKETSAAAILAALGGTLAVSGPLTDTQLRANAVPVSGPLTDTQLRANAVPVSGTVTATGPLTDTQLRASAVPVQELPRTDYLIATGTRDATTGPGTAVIAAAPGQRVEYHIIKCQRIASTGDQTVVLKSGATTLDSALCIFDSNVPGIIEDLNGKLLGGVNEAQYFDTATAITFKYRIIYRLV